MNSTSTFDASRYYPFIMPLLMGGTFLALLGNLYLLMCIPWIRRQAMTANLRLSLSLAGSDAWAAVLLLNGWMINNVIPHMFYVKIGDWIRCYYLILEMLRMSGLVTSAIHLLALALNHFFSIVSPLKYQTTVTPAFSYVCIAFLWISPLMSMFVLASAYENDGFRTPNCGTLFYYRYHFRLAVFIQFIAPLILMVLIYSYILMRLSAARRRCVLLQKPLRKQSGRINSDASIVSGSTSSHKRTRKQSTESRISTFSSKSRKSSENRLSISRSRKQSTESKSSVNLSFNRLSAIKHKIKAIMTTLLILGTFVIGWLPAVFMFFIVCLDCYVKFKPTAEVFAANILVNTLLVSKLLLNPFIYAYRLAEIRYALWVMHATRLGRRPLNISRLPTKFKKMAPSVVSVNNGRPLLKEQARAVPLLISKITDNRKRSDGDGEEERKVQEKICHQCAKDDEKNEKTTNYETAQDFENSDNDNEMFTKRGRTKKSYSWHYGMAQLRNGFALLEKDS